MTHFCQILCHNIQFHTPVLLHADVPLHHMNYAVIVHETLITGLITDTSWIVLALYCIASFPFVYDNNWVYMWKYHIILMYLLPHHVKPLTHWCI